MGVSFYILNEVNLMWYIKINLDSSILSLRIRNMI